MKFCNKCGTEITGNEKFCRKCGVNLSAHNEESKKQEHYEVHTTKKRTWKTYTLYTLLILLILFLAFTSYQYYYYFEEYNNYYSKFRYEESEKDRYINLFNTEKQNKESEISKRRQTESQLSDAHATIQAKNTEILELRNTLIEEQNIRDSLQNELSQAQTHLGQTSEQLSVLRNEVNIIRDELNWVGRWIRDAAYIEQSRLNVINSLAGSAITIKENTCIIDANKIGSDMNTKLGFTYEYKKLDKTPAHGYSWYYDLDTFWLSKEGVCVDYAIFVSARLRTEIKKANNLCDEVYVKLSNSKYIKCPCFVYAVGGKIRGTTSDWHMVSAVSKNNNPKQSNFHDYHCFESQSGKYHGSCNDYFEPLRSVFSINDFIYIDPNTNIRYSLSNTKSKLDLIK